MSVRGAGHRLGRIWANRRLVVRAGAAAGLAWFIAERVLGHANPFFAPIAAVIVLGGSAGLQLRRAVELVVGVAVGIVVGDLLIAVLGSGPLQLGVVVGLAMAAALFLGSGVLIANQAAASAVLIATLYPPSGGIYYSRWIDALIGGGVALAVHALLLPPDPLSAVRTAANPLLAELADSIAAVADALRAGDLLGSEETLTVLRATEPALRGLTGALANARETVSVAPVRWRDRERVDMYLAAAGHLDHAVRNARVLARRAREALRTGERVPEELPAALEELAGAVRALSAGMASDFEPEPARERAVRAATRATGAVTGAAGISVTVMAAQVRSVALDLLMASGLDEPAALDLLDASTP